VLGKDGKSLGSIYTQWFGERRKRCILVEENEPAQLKKKGATMPAIVRELTFAAAPQCVWGALTQPEEIGQWWTNDLNVTQEVGSLAEFRFGEWGDVVLRFEVAELEQDKIVHWMYQFGSVAHWAGTSVTWRLEPVGNGARVVFRHEQELTVFWAPSAQQECNRLDEW
jgi:uncharacterized protein YndB with AHSA1/START domain